MGAFLWVLELIRFLKFAAVDICYLLNICCGFTLQPARWQAGILFFCHTEFVEGQTNKKRIYTSIRQLFGGQSFFSFTEAEFNNKKSPN